ncbi:MAG: MFS transporter [Halobacteriales archaeon]
MGYNTDGEERLFRGHSGRLFVLITIAFLSVKLVQRLLPPLLPVIIDDLAITSFLAGVALSVMSLFRAGMQFPSGRFADALTRTTVLLAALGLVVTSLLVLMVTPSYVGFVIGVALFGMASGLYDPADRALLSDLFREKRGRAFGLHMMGSDGSGILAAGLAVWIVTVASWRAAFLPSLVVLAVVPIVLYRLSRESVVFEEVELGALATGHRLFGDPRMRWLLLSYSLFVFASIAVTSFLPTFLTAVHGVSLAVASSAFALLYAVGIVAKPIAGTVSDRFHRPIVAGSGLAVGGAGLAVIVGAPDERIAIAGIVLYALGQRAVPPALQSHLMDRFPDESMGGDLGAMRTVYMGVGSLGPAYIGLLADRFDYIAAYTSLIALFLLAAGVLFWLSASR